MEKEEGDLQSLNLKACGSSYIIFICICGIPLSLSIFALYMDSSFWKLTVICLGSLIFSIAWLRSFRLLVTNNSIIYSTLFHGTKKFLWTEVTKAEIEIGCFKYIDRFKPTIRLVIEPISSDRKPSMIVNLKIFNATEVAKVLKIIDGMGKLGHMPNSFDILNSDSSLRSE